MKRNRWICFYALAALALLGILGPGLKSAEPVSSGTKEAAKSSLPPLIVDKDSPLLLDESKPAPNKVKADNSACFVCHANYSTEQLAETHAKENIGCVDCHGVSTPHRNDENNITPPDVIFPANKIEGLCDNCHKTHDAPAKKVLARWFERHPGKSDPEMAVCTDCHGEHRLKLRTVRWDKTTRKLIKSAK